MDLCIESPLELQALRAQLQALTDREAIRTVLHEYCRAVDRGDATLMKACYHPDGTDDHGFFVGRGWDFADYVLPRLAELDRSIHSLSNPLITLDGDRAHVETQWSVIHRLERATKLTDCWHQGRYLDEFERRDGRWRILRRVTVLDAERWIHTADLQRLVPHDHPQRVYRGERGAGDPVHRLGRLGTLARPAFRLERLWQPLRQALRLPTGLLHLLGRAMQSRARRGRGA
ncbi:MAG: nuclear transport factor 2 family protein [Piscinibacter sp.]|nr:nuclear transport factor 2 family protein [Piscinibacter sp.]